MSNEPKKGHEALLPLVTEAVPVDEHCIGDRWETQNIDQLAKLVAIIAMGQASYAAHILTELFPASPAFSPADLIKEASVRLSVQEKKATPRAGYPRWQRDGFIFEAISWIAARQSHGKDVLLKDPHISSTSQGLDGLMIELSPDHAAVVATTIFEDKCTDEPRDTFLYKVIPAFLERHQNRRSAELVATASVLLRTGGLDDATSTKLAAAVMERKLRRYRAAFAVTAAHDSEAQRKELFDGYEKVAGIKPEQRIGACFIVPAEVRDWFDSFAVKANEYLDSLAEEVPDV